MSKQKNTPDWTEEDLQIIRDNYSTKTSKEIVSLLSIKRTEKSIRHKVQKLGLRKTVKVDNYDEIKYKTIDNVLHKMCKQCGRYLPLDFLYFPRDNTCEDKLRNICKECKGESFVISDAHYWTQEETEIFIKEYPKYTNKEFINKFFSYLTTKQLHDKAYSLKIYKLPDVKRRSLIESFTDNWRKSISISRIKRGVAKGKNNPMFGSKRIGSLNPNYKGGISALYQELRRNLKQWKIDSIENGNYQCFLTKKRFDDIHHLYSFDNIVKDTLNETGLPLYEDISFYSNEEIKLLVNKCLEIHYRHPLGVCLEEKYHSKFHEEFGYGGNTEEQFYEFLNNYYNGKYKDLEEVS